VSWLGDVILGVDKRLCSSTDRWLWLCQWKQRFAEG